MELSLERVADAVMALRVDLRDRPELERRMLPRFPVWAPRTFYPTGDAWGTGVGATSPFEVWLIDIACGGVGFHSRQPLLVGREFHVVIPAAEGTETVMRCKVVHCRKAVNGTYTGGAQFVEEVPQLPGAASGASPAAAAPAGV